MKMREKVLHFVKAYIDRHGYPPTVREIKMGVGLRSAATVHGHLERLKKSGNIEWVPGKSRTLKLIHNEEMVAIPVYTPEQLAAAYKKYGQVPCQEEK